jgi:hypothetical protein
MIIFFHTEKKFANSRINELNFITETNIYCQINAITNGRIGDDKNLQTNIEKYFLEDIGLTKKQLEMLKERLT